MTTMDQPLGHPDGPTGISHWLMGQPPGRPPLRRPAARRQPRRLGAAPLKDNHYQVLQLVLFWAGAILLPLGLVVIVLAGTARPTRPYQYDQLSYLVSGACSVSA